MLTRETFIGPWAGLPVAWTDDDQFDEQTYRGDVARCCQAGIPGVYSGGTSGEFYAMEFDEFKAVARATVEECHHHGKPAMVGCSSTYTLGAARRAAFAAKIGADAIQVALPFWMELANDQIVPFFKEVTAAADGMPITIYETMRAKKRLTVHQHHEILEAVPNYLMVKSNAGTVGATPEGCQVLSRYVNVFVREDLWGTLGRKGAVGSCSALVYWNPKVILRLWEQLKNKDWAPLAATGARVRTLHKFLFDEFGPKGFTDTAYDHMGGRASGFLKASLRSRGPYPSPTERDVQTLRQWYREHFTDMLEL